jgi:integrase
MVDLHWNGERIRLYSDKEGYALDSKKRAERLLSHIQYEIDHQLFDPRNYVKRQLQALLFVNYAESWLQRREMEQKRDQISRGYFEVSRGWVRKYMIPFFGAKNLRDIWEGAVEDFRDSLPESLSGKTVYNIMGLLHKILKDAKRRHDIDRVPDFPKVEVDEVEIQFIGPEKQDAIIGHVSDPMCRALFTFLRYQACRPGEARALRWERVDLQEGVVTLDGAMDLGHRRGRTKERNILKRPLHPEVIAILKTLPRDIGGFVFTSKGKPISKSKASAVWKQAAEKAGIKITMYAGTRHSFAMDALNGGVDRNLLGKFLGHKDPRSIDRYCKYLTNTFKEVWNRDCLQTVCNDQNNKGKVLNFKG